MFVLYIARDFNFYFTADLKIEANEVTLKKNHRIFVLLKYWFLCATKILIPMCIKTCDFYCNIKKNILCEHFFFLSFFFITSTIFFFNWKLKYKVNVDISVITVTVNSMFCVMCFWCFTSFGVATILSSEDCNFQLMQWQYYWANIFILFSCS